MNGSLASERIQAWEHLAQPSSPVAVFDPMEVVDLPEPARRFLSYTIAPGTPITPTVILDMEGLIKLDRWMPFRAHQVLRAREGFVWKATVGDAPIVLRGGDAYRGGRGSLDFRLWGVLPVARSVGPDTDRSAAGRLAAETVAWAPQALTPQMGAAWTGIDETHATVAVPVGDGTVDVTIGVDRVGRLRELALQRWGNPDDEAFDLYSFGGDVDARAEFSGVTIATSGRVGWHWDTAQRESGVFFRYRITGVHLPTDQTHLMSEAV